MKQLVVMLFFLVPVLHAQDHDLLYMYNGKKAVLYLTVAPESGEYIQIFRSSGAEMVLLNKDNPLMAVDNPGSVAELTGDEYPQLQKYLDAEDIVDVYRSIKGNSARAALATLVFPGAAVAAGRSFTDSDVVEGTSYTYKIVYMDGDQQTAEFTKKVTAVKGTVAAPAGVKAEFKRGVVKLNWTYPAWSADKNNLAIQFRVYKKEADGKFALINKAPLVRNDEAAPEFMVGISAAETEAEFYVTAVDPVGNESSPSVSVKVKTVSDELPEKPEGVQASAGPGMINIVWNNAAEGAIDGFNIYRKESLSDKALKLNKALIPAVSPFYADTAVRSGVMFFYYVSAVSKTGKEGKMSNVATAIYNDETPPAQPSEVKVSIAGKFIKIEWKKSSSKDAAEYGVYKGTSPKILGKIGAAKGTSYIDSGYTAAGFEAAGDYYYSVTAVDRSGNESPRVTPVKVIYPDREPPKTPSPFIAKMGEGKSVRITSGMSGSGDLVKINIYKSSVEAKAKPVLFATLKRPPVDLTDTAVVMGKSYIYSIEAIDSSGNKSSLVQSDPVLIKSSAAPPVVPFVTAVKKKSGVVVIWLPVVKKDLAGYMVYRADLATGVYKALTARPITGTEYTDTNGSMGQFYKIKAFDTSGNESEFSEFAPVYKEVE